MSPPRIRLRTDDLRAHGISEEKLSLQLGGQHVSVASLFNATSKAMELEGKPVCPESFPSLDINLVVRYMGLEHLPRAQKQVGEVL